SPPPLPSFPTRRSSDLAPHPLRVTARSRRAVLVLALLSAGCAGLTVGTGPPDDRGGRLVPRDPLCRAGLSGRGRRDQRDRAGSRSEEHTSELQSLAYLV